MNASRLLGRIAVSVTAAAGLVVGTAGAAVAAPVKLGGCAVVTPTKGWVTQTVWIDNYCSTDRSFRVISVGPQLGFRCFTVASGTRGGWRFPTSKKYLWTEFC
ncbi:hypothetical protein Aau02nite_01140 [Amorphoplanes auranticolor]|uniref:Secreted protein n=1 Tax=Actinoplanes auranticolor TaxID=47988 RepID=A0A919S3M1_9ACTN|nr:hypothetical protein Aau02nite_01140 [Actinoplanes auranticolor]